MCQENVHISFALVRFFFFHFLLSIFACCVLCTLPFSSSEYQMQNYRQAVCLLAVHVLHLCVLSARFCYFILFRSARIWSCPYFLFSFFVIVGWQNANAICVCAVCTQYTVCTQPIHHSLIMMCIYLLYTLYASHIRQYRIECVSCCWCRMRLFYSLHLASNKILHAVNI